MPTRTPEAPSDDAVPHAARPLPAAILAGALSGLVAGVAIGAMAGPGGVVAGVAAGLGFGAIAGAVIDREERRRDHRTRELDEEIGITHGSMGAGPVSLVPASLEEAREDRERWLAEWLTPPPPAAMLK